MKEFVYFAKRFILVFCLSFTFLCSMPAFGINADYDIKGSDEAEGSQKSVASEGPLGDTLCQIILMLSGRIGRLAAAIACFIVGIMFLLGKITWPFLVTMVIGFALIFGAKSIVIAFLPNYIMVRDPNQQKDVAMTPEEIINSNCRELATVK